MAAVDHDLGEEQYRDDTYWEQRFSLQIDPESYQGTLHDSLPVALKQGLEEDDGFRDYFEIQEPNRVWVEGESSGYWENAEDFVITGSHEGGEMILGQVVSCDRKEYPYTKMERQVEYFFASNMFSDDAVEDTWEYAFVLGVDIGPEEVEQEEERLEEAVEADEAYEVDLLARKLELEELAEDWSLEIDPSAW